MTGSMNYDQRISYLKNWLGTDILSRFNMPRDLDQKIIAMDTIEAVNRNLPSPINKERMGQLVALITKELTQSAQTRTLPNVKAFIEATRFATRGTAAETALTPSVGRDTYKINEARIRAGEAIPDTFLRGTMREQLIARTSITDADLAPYESVDYTAHKQ